MSATPPRQSRPIIHLHSPDGVAAMRAALMDEPIPCLHLALGELERFKGRSYFTDGDAGVFTYWVLWHFMRDHGLIR